MLVLIFIVVSAHSADALPPLSFWIIPHGTPVSPAFTPLLIFIVRS
jgi:hypothetical protein